ncbi:MAG TPA: ATP-dependent zinc metalloprotease FtsH, partial [Spongiibacteraceae bacterium]|nr:ATP-dependent zinc metalloprotease FtsH [Spongiibacteraceae bacterium]
FSVDKRVHFSLWYFFAAILLLLTIHDYIVAGNIAALPYGQFKQAIKQNAVKDLAIASDRISGQVETTFLKKTLPEGKVPKTTSDWSEFITVRVPDDALVSELDAANIDYGGVIESTFLKTVLSWVIPAAIMVLIWQYFIGRMGAGGGMMAIGKSKARIYVDKDIKVSFNDIAGIDEAVDELRDVVSFLQQPEHYTQLGGRLPKGILLVGPPGTGKTLLARAVAGEAKVKFFSLSGSEFVEMFVGVGAARVRDLFTQAQQNAPCIIFIDELDALGRARGVNMVGSNEEREQTLNQLLTEMDGFDPNEGVILMAATNRPEILDPALLRAGRFDRHVVVDRPDVKGREAILRIHTRKVKLGGDVNIDIVAARTPGFVGADLENIVNEAALLAARGNKTAVTMSDFEEAIDRVQTGLRKKSSLMTEKEKHRVAFHESGHALASLLVKNADPVHKVSIIPRGIGALGMTLQLPTEDRHLYTHEELLDRIAVLLAGRAAEEIVFNDFSTGAADDLQKASEMARRVVAEFGMGNALGAMVVPIERSAFLNQSQQRFENTSEATSQAIDSEIKQILQQIYAMIRAALTEKIGALRELAQQLETKETIDGETVKHILLTAVSAETSVGEGGAAKAASP